MREEKLSNVTVESISSLIVQTPALVTSCDTGYPLTPRLCGRC
jgi:hypothetical protein